MCNLRVLARARNATCLNQTEKETKTIFTVGICLTCYMINPLFYVIYKYLYINIHMYNEIMPENLYKGDLHMFALIKAISK